MMLTAPHLDRTGLLAGMRLAPTASQLKRSSLHGSAVI